MADKGKHPLEEGEGSNRPPKRTVRIGYARRACVGIWLGGTRAIEEEILPPASAAEPAGPSRAPTAAEPVGQAPPRVDPVGQYPVPEPREVILEERPMVVEVNMRGTEHQVNTSTIHLQVFRPDEGFFEAEEGPRFRAGSVPPVGVPPQHRAGEWREEAPRPREGGAVQMGAPAPAPREEEEESEEDPEEGPLMPDPAEQDPVEVPQPDAEPLVPQAEDQGEEDEDDEDDEDEPVDADDWAMWGDAEEEEEAIGWGAASPEPTSTVTTVSSDSDSD